MHRDFVEVPRTQHNLLHGVHQGQKQEEGHVPPHFGADCSCQTHESGTEGQTPPQSVVLGQSQNGQQQGECDAEQGFHPE